jgi:hypothetical protein
LQTKLTQTMPHAAVGDPDSRGICVAVLSVTPLTSTAKIRALPDGLATASPVRLRAATSPR